MLLTKFDEPRQERVYSIQRVCMPATSQVQIPSHSSGGVRKGKDLQQRRVGGNKSRTLLRDTTGRITDRRTWSTQQSDHVCALFGSRVVACSDKIGPNSTVTSAAPDLRNSSSSIASILREPICICILGAVQEGEKQEHIFYLRTCASRFASPE